MADEAVVASKVADEIPVAPVVLPELKINLASDGKPEIRTKVWDYLADNKLASFPWPPHKRIPSFKGAEDAGDRLSGMDVFTKAETLKVDPDKPLQQLRIRTLEANKKLVVPTPRLRYGFLNRITPPADADKKMIKTCATRQGFAEFSAPVDLEEALSVNLVVVGSVAVSPKGWRVGKGEGYSDLEYAIMASMKTVNPSVPVIAIVHDCQVMDLPEGIFGSHDVPVDYIVTPTRIITCENRPVKPAGIIWSILSAEKLAEIPILRKLRFRDWKDGKDVKISGEAEPPTDLQDEVVKTEDSEERRSKPRPFRKNSNRRRNRRSEGGVEDKDGAGDGGDGVKGGRRYRGDSSRELDGGQSGDGEARQNGGGGPRRGFRSGRGRGGGWRGRGGRRGGRRSGDSRGSDPDRDGDYRKDGDYDNERSDDIDDKENHNGGGGRSYRSGGGERRRPNRPNRRPMEDFEGSVYVGSLPRSLRVSDFKGEVRVRKVNPLRVMWRGSSGFAFLNFKTKVEAEEALVALEGLHFDDHNLRLEMAKERERRVRGGGGGPGGVPRRRQRDSQGEEDEGDQGDN